MSFEKLIKRFVVKTAPQRFIVQRGWSWLGTLGMGFVVVATLQKYVELPIWLLYPLGMLVIWFVGWLDVIKLKSWSSETEYTFKTNPIFQRMEEFQKESKKRLNRIERRLKKGGR